LGKTNCTGINLQSLATNRFSTAELFGKLANISPDLPKATLRDTGNIKALSGGDAITAEHKFHQPFTFTNKAKLIFAANQPPIIDDESLAL